jgi:dienelactone hydrolase
MKIYKLFIYAAIITVTIFILITYLNLQNFPKPTGHYGVGKTQLHLIDSSRKETNAQNAKRELMLHIWYPTSSKINTPERPYNADALGSAIEFMSHQSGVPEWLFAGLKKTKTYAQKNTSVATDSPSYPVIITSHGAGTMIQHYTWLCEELASKGYIVVGINHPYMAAVTRFPDNRIVKSLINSKNKEGKEAFKVWKQEQFEVAVKDVKFVVDNLIKLNEQSTWPLHNKLNLDHLGICGHSAGGSLAMRMCLEDKRFKAGIALDGTTQRGNEKLTPFTTPFLDILSDISLVGKEGNEQYKKLLELCHKPEMHMNIIMLKGIGHGAFSDLPALLHPTLLTQAISRFISVDLGASSAQGIKAIAITKRYVDEFFDKFLKNGNSTLFDQPQCNKEITI